MNLKNTNEVLSLVLVLYVVSLLILALSFAIRDPKSAGASSLSASPPSASPAPVETPINTSLAAVRELDHVDGSYRIVVYLLPSGERICVVNYRHSSRLSVVRLADAPEQLGAKDVLQQPAPDISP